MIGKRSAERAGAGRKASPDRAPLIAGHLARLGGVLIRPRSTLLAILRGGEGSAWELFPWIVVVTAAAAPIETGRALVLMRVELLTGLWTLLSTIADRASAGLIGAVVVAFVLGRWDVSFDRAFDCAMYLLVPYLLLVAVGAGCSLLGAEIWFLPHRRLTGVPWVIAVRVLAGYGWSLILFGVVVADLFRGRNQPEPSQS